MDLAAYYAGAQWTKPALEAELVKWMTVLETAQLGGRERVISGPDGIRVDLDLVSIDEIKGRIGCIQAAIAAVDPVTAPAGAVRLILPQFGSIPL